MIELRTLQAAFFLSISGGVALLFAKMTFFVMYLDIFQPMRWMRICSIIGTITTLGFYSGMIMSNIVLSVPDQGQPWIESSNRALILVVPLATGGLVIDLFILILPIIAISKLQLSPRRRLGVHLIFVSGAL